MERYNSVIIDNDYNEKNDYNDNSDESNMISSLKFSTSIQEYDHEEDYNNDNYGNSKNNKNNNNDNSINFNYKNHIENTNGREELVNHDTFPNYADSHVNDTNTTTSSSPSDNRTFVILEMNRLLNPSSTKALNEERDSSSSPIYYYAIQEWKSIKNLDRFLERVYQYYEERGFLSLIFNRISNLTIVAFLVVVIVMLTYGIDWSFIHLPASSGNHPQLWNVIKGLSGIPWYIWITLIEGIILWIWLGPVRLIMEISEWKKVSRFYNVLLEIKDSDLSSMEFDMIMTRIIKLHDDHPISLHKLDPLGIVMRIMRRENYLIALFNKDILNISMPISFHQHHHEHSNRDKVKDRKDGEGEGALTMLTKTLEWNLSFCIINYFFDENLLIRPVLIKEAQKERLIEELQKRCFLMAIINLIFAPFIFLLIFIHFIFRYGEQVYKNPKSIGERTFSPLARWKLRHFNELPYYFQRRLSNSYKKAGKFMDQFHNDRWSGIARLFSFVSGSIVLILLAITMINEDLLMHFEITKSRNTIWYIGLFGLILAISRSALPEHTQSKDPEKLMMEISQYTHYLPIRWKKLGMRSESVKQEFGSMFQYRTILLIQELLSIIVTPFILYYRLPTCCDRIVEFFREFTVHVDGLGYVCSFALFDFRNHGNPSYGGNVYHQTTSDQEKREKIGIINEKEENWQENEHEHEMEVEVEITDKHNQTRHGKMEQSFINFTVRNLIFIYFIGKSSKLDS